MYDIQTVEQMQKSLLSCGRNASRMTRPAGAVCTQRCHCCKCPQTPADNKHSPEKNPLDTLPKRPGTCTNHPEL
ncbi:hypothetical protein SKAU_G00241300 [Synaphobranchus kaupii]|uniref:Uncharacterized protein n=1 Tax=Synaphobranchus kaupii TaxID=118154 RepID=A0A9Q1F7K7_SYNKA|nr:hypothetical protein SKAU_G00241300 [Synaphobranchus kaupii]